MSNRGNAPDPQEPVVRIRDVTKRYARGETPAVDRVDLTAGDGEVVGLVGESGCGKTTLLRLVAGLEIPDSGTVRLAGRDVAGPTTWVPPERRAVGMVFQDFALFPHLKAADNVAYGLRALPRRKRRARAEEVLEQVGLVGLGDRYPHQLSGGQQQRVALARALAPEPRLLLLDEPFSNLDSALKRTLREELAEIFRHTGITALLVVHDAEDVLALADRVAVMRAGRIRQVETPDFLYRQPHDEYVARFFGETNILHANPSGAGLDTDVGHIALTGSTLTDAGPVRICFRPEDFHVSTDPGDGRPARVRQVRTRGLHRRIIVALEDGAAAGATLTLHVTPDFALAEGDRVFVRPKEGSAHVFPSGDASPRKDRRVG